MAKKIIPIDYTNADFEKLKRDLVNYAKRYYPNTYKDFNEASFGSLMTDLVAYVGDNLSFYLDYSANESFLNTSLEYDNVLEHAKQMGYRHKPFRSSVGNVDIYVPIPADDANVEPDRRYLPRILRGTSFSTASGNVFTLTEDIEFLDSTSEIVANQVSEDCSRTTYYIAHATGQVVSGEESQVTVEVEDYKRFLKILIPGSNITDIVSVVDADGNEYFEVDFLSQNVIYRPILSRTTNTGEIDPSAPSIIRAYPVPRRFIVERSGTDVYIVFGYGSEKEIKDNKITDPSEIVLDMAGKNYISDATFDPSKLLSTDKFGVTPVNTSLTVTFRANTADNVNTGAQTINKVISPKIEFREINVLDSAKINYILSNIQVSNASPINGDITMATTEEIKHRAAATFAMQGRAVTLQDYVSATYAMPSAFGSVKRAAIYRDNDDYTRNMNMHVISEDANGKLQQCSMATKQNLKTWLNSVRMVNDSLDIFDTNIINLGINFTALCPRDVNKNAVFNEAKEEIYRQINEVKPEIGEPFSISEVFRILKSVEEILDVSDISIVSKSTSSHSSFAYNINGNMSQDGRMLHIPKNCIWEIKFKNDITGTIV